MWFWCQKQFFNDGINISESEDSASFYRVEHKCTQPIYCALDKQATGGWLICMHLNVLKCASGGVLVQEYPLLTSGGGPRMLGGPVTSDQVCSTWGLVLQKVPSEGL